MEGCLGLLGGPWKSPWMLLKADIKAVSGKITFSQNLQANRHAKLFISACLLEENAGDLPDLVSFYELEKKSRDFLKLNRSTYGP